MLFCGKPLGFGMITYYSQPLPGIGVSFYHLFIDQGLNLANQLNHSLVQEVWDRLTGLYWGMETPALTLALNFMEIIRYAVTILGLLAAQAAIFGVIAFGYVAAAIAVLLGPIFIPFFIVPGLEWLFWGWFKSLIQYAFYPVVANAYLFVFGNMLIHFVDAHPAPYNGAAMLLFFYPLLMDAHRLYIRDFEDSAPCQLALYGAVRGNRPSNAVALGETMEPTPWMPPPEKDYAAAQRQYVELYGSVAVMNTYLKIAVLSLCLVVLAARGSSQIFLPNM
jgi:hypothetical protein